MAKSRKTTPPEYFPFYPVDWLNDDKVLAMTASAKGAYIQLLCHAWRQSPPCTIPNDDAALASMAGVTPVEWSAIRGQVLVAWTPVGGRLRQRRLYQVFLEVRKTMRAISQQRTAAINARWGKSNKKRNLEKKSSDTAVLRSNSVVIRNDTNRNRNRKGKEENPPNPPGGTAPPRAREETDGSIRSTLSEIFDHEPPPVVEFDAPTEASGEVAPLVAVLARFGKHPHRQSGWFGIDVTQWVEDNGGEAEAIPKLNAAADAGIKSWKLAKEWCKEKTWEEAREMVRGNSNGQQAKSNGQSQRGNGQSQPAGGSQRAERSGREFAEPDIAVPTERYE